MGFLVKAVKSVVKAVVGIVSKVVGGIFGFIVGGKSNNKKTAKVSNLNKSLEPEAYCKIVLGRVASPLDVRFWQVYGANGTQFDEVLALAGHRINAVKELYFENELAVDASGVVQSKYIGVLTRDVRLGANGQTALTVGDGTQWNTNATFDGCGHMVLRWLPDEKKLPNGIPSRYTQVVEGAPVYDPRRDSTVLGGSGSHRINDRDTWTYSTLDGNGVPIGRNNALQALWYVLGWFVPVKDANGTVTGSALRVGRGVDPQDINLASFIAGANACEAAGYYTDLVLSSEDNHTSNEDKITCDGLIGRLIDPGGLWSYYANVNDTANIAVELTDADVLADSTVTWNEYRPMADQYNQVRGKYVNPSPVTLFQAFPYPMVRDATYETNLGVKRAKPQDFEQVLDSTLAQRLARLLLNQGQYQGEYSASFNYRGVKAQAWSVVRYTSERFGWTKLFRVWRHEISTDAGVGMLLKEIHPSIWSAGSVTQPQPTNVGKLYDPRQEISVTGLSCVQITIEGPGDNPTIIDGGRVSWTAPPENVRRTEIRYRVNGTTFWETVAPVTRGTNETLIFPLLKSASYNVQARHVSINEIEGPWISAPGFEAGDNGNVDYAGIVEASENAIWEKITSPLGLKPEDNATKGAPAGTKIGGIADPLTGIVTGGVLAEQIVVDVSNIGGTVDTVVRNFEDLESINRQRERDLDRLSQAVIQAIGVVNANTKNLTDAGLIVDEATGKATLYSVSANQESVNLVRTDLDAVKGQLNLKASTTYVNQAITAAQLPNLEADLDTIFVRTTDLEIGLDALTGTLALKADAVTVTGLEGTVTGLSQTLDALNGTISTKAETTTVSALSTRVSSVEETFDSLGDTIGVSTTIRQARYDTGLQGEALLKSLLAGDKNNQAVLVQMGYIKSELTVKIDDRVSVESAKREEFVAQMNGRTATIQNTLIALATADTAQTTRIADAESKITNPVTGLIAAHSRITTEESTRATNELATAGVISNITSSITNPTTGLTAAHSRITEESATRATAVSTVANRALTLESQMAGTADSFLRSTIFQEQTTRATADSTNATNITNLTSVIADPNSGLARSHARITTEENTRASQTEALSTRATTVEAQMNGTANSFLKSAITTEATTRSTADETNATAIQTLNSVVVDANTGLARSHARITTEENTRASADGALATRAATLEAQFRGDTDSIVYARIRTEETTRADATAALATRADSLDARFNLTIDSNLYARIRTEETARADAVGAVATRAATLEAQFRGEQTSTVYSRILTEETTRASADGALSSRINSLDSQFTLNTDSALFARIRTEETTRANQTGALSTRTGTLESKMSLGEESPMFARVRTEEQARVDAVSAQAMRTDTLTTVVDGHTSTLTTYGQSINGISAKHGIRLDVNGFVSGVEQNNNGTSSSFNVLASEFAFAAPGVTPRKIFGVNSSGANLNGDLYMTGTGRIISIVGNYRKMDGNGFGLNGDLLEWYGLNSIPLGQETKTNGILTTSTDGRVRFPTNAPLDSAGAEITGGGGTASTQDFRVTGSGLYGTATRKLNPGEAIALSFQLIQTGTSVSGTLSGNIRANGSDIAGDTKNFSSGEPTSISAQTVYTNNTGGVQVVDFTLLVNNSNETGSIYNSTGSFFTVAL